jgi:AcrR family transcriptional regulator
MKIKFVRFYFHITNFNVSQIILSERKNNMPGRKAERKHLFNQMIRTDIQKAVRNLVTRTGTRSVTMDQVATEAGVSKGCLYLHFRSKKELVESVKEGRLHRPSLIGQRRPFKKSH